MLLGFVVPVKPRAVSVNWQYDCQLLERTLRSICAQTNDSFAVFVIYTDMPEIKYTNDHIHYLHFPYKNISSGELSDYDTYGNKYYDPDFASKIMDKIRKLSLGCQHAKEMQCKYIMAVDSDDLVSKDIVAYIDKQAEKGLPGWYINKGYIYKEGSRYLIHKNRNMHMLNGSTHIIREDLIRIPDFNSKAMQDYSFFESHGYLATRLKHQYNVIIEPLPFEGVIYVLHDQNWSDISEWFNINTLKRFVKQLLNLKFNSRLLKSEFGLMPLQNKVE